jgi:AcrR family transcriptional regulator
MSRLFPDTGTGNDDGGAPLSASGGPERLTGTEMRVTQEATPVEVLSRRDRMRAATTEEIKQTARRILVGQGPEAVSLRAIAREMGMTAPALYRYFTSREDLIRNVVGDIFNELSSDIGVAIREASQSSEDITAKLIAACREFRRWSFGHQGEFALIFGSPLPGVDDGRGDFADECGRRFAGVFFALFYELWRRSPFPVRAPDEIDPGLRAQLERFRTVIGADLPLGAMLTFLRCWTKLYGAVSMEVFGHIGFALDDAAPMFEITLSELAGDVGLAYVPGS